MKPILPDCCGVSYSLGEKTSCELRDSPCGASHRGREILSIRGTVEHSQGTEDRGTGFWGEQQRYVLEQGAKITLLPPPQSPVPFWALLISVYNFYSPVWSCFYADSRA